MIFVCKSTADIQPHNLVSSEIVNYLSVILNFKVTMNIILAFSIYIYIYIYIY